eukprot:6178521-Prymnesium_polylepis.1
MSSPVRTRRGRERPRTAASPRTSARVCSANTCERERWPRMAARGRDRPREAARVQYAGSRRVRLALKNLNRL